MSNPELRSTGELPLLHTASESPLRSGRGGIIIGAPGPAQEWALARRGDGTAPPAELPDGDAHLAVTRTFCFADLSGFTPFTRKHGPEAAVERLGSFRRITRNVAAKRGVRVAKWLGDGVMLVSTEPAPAIALCADLVHRYNDAEVQVRVGAATGTALLFEGDDYIGEPVNLANKLCNAARPHEILADIDASEVPRWIDVVGEAEVSIRGVGRIGGILRLRPAPDAGSGVAGQLPRSA